MIRSIIAALTAPFLLANATADEAGIRAVIETFRTAIIAKDRAALERLPANDAISFISALDPDTHARIRKRRPDVARTRASSYAQFVTDVVTNPARQEEKLLQHPHLVGRQRRDGLVRL